MCYTAEAYEADTAGIRPIDTDIIALDEKIMQAERRSYHTFFDVHVLQAADGSYLLFEEGDYGELPPHLIDDIVYTAAGKMGDEY